MAINGGHRASADGTWAEGGTNPPGTGWDGVFTFKTK